MVLAALEKRYEIAKARAMKRKRPKKSAGRERPRPASTIVSTAAPVLPKTGGASNVGRVAFTTSRELEFFTESELTTQIGYRKGLWPLVLIKELIDNGIDACEKAGTGAIEIAVELGKDFIRVSDNGPGIDPKIIKGVLDYTVRISDKKHYVSPTRGQLGNALKCVVATAFVATGERGQLEITAKGRHYTIEVLLDRIAQKPKITCTKTTAPIGIGTILNVHWNEVASYFDGGSSLSYRNLHAAVEALLGEFAAFNPHVSFIFNGKRRSATDPDWQKWRPDQPTSAHWYRPEDLRARIAAHITERDLPIRDFVSGFDGLKGSRTRTAMLATAKMDRVHLSNLVRDGDVDMARVETLLGAMREHSRPVQPKRLGVIGQEHLAHYLKSLGGKPTSFRYHKKAFIDYDGLPVVLEIAFAIKPDAKQGWHCILGLNWSPVFKVPSGEIYRALSSCQVESSDPVILVISVVRPRFEFTDHGKGLIA